MTISNQSKKAHRNHHRKAKTITAMTTFAQIFDHSRDSQSGSVFIHFLPERGKFRYISLFIYDWTSKAQYPFILA